MSTQPNTDPRRGKPTEPDTNARRLIVLRRYLESGLTLPQAVKATNKFFKRQISEAA